MKDIIVDRIMDNISKYYSYDNVKLNEIKYGLQTLYLSLFKIIVIYIMSFFIHTTKHLCLLFLCYLPLRVFGFGLHTKSSKQCWILSLSVFFIIPYIIKNIYINDLIMKVLSIPLLILMSIYSPSDTEKRPLVNKNKRIVYKLLSIIITFIYIIIIYLSKNSIIQRLLFMSILLEVLLIIPISYKILGLKYGNYKLYKMKGGKYEIIS